jgi:hypothetical protein
MNEREVSVSSHICSRCFFTVLQCNDTVRSTNVRLIPLRRLAGVADCRMGSEFFRELASVLQRDRGIRHR